MTSRQQRIQTLYEISLSINSRESLEATADRALTAYLQKLNCSVGAVFRVDNTNDSEALSLVASIPAKPKRNTLFQMARGQLSELVTRSVASPDSSEMGSHAPRGNDRNAVTVGGSGIASSFVESLPVAEQVEGMGEYHIMNLPGFGAIVLGKHGGAIEQETAAALAPLNKKLAQACRSNVTEQRLREQRNRFETLFDAVPEPVVNVVIENGTERVVRANEAFKNTFVGDEGAIRGHDLNNFVGPDTQSDTAKELIDTIEQGHIVNKEIHRETRSGSSHFLFSGVPVAASDQAEYFGVYVDITEQKEREQTLEKLYNAAQDILDQNSRQQVCTYVVETIESVLGYSAAGIHLYRRRSGALEPEAVNGRVQQRLCDKLAEYTETETILWRAYNNGEPVRIDDTDQVNSTLLNGETPMKSVVALPIGGHGVLITSAFETNAFSDRDVYLLRLLSQLAEIALSRTINEEGLRAVQETVRDALHADTHEEMAELVLEKMPDALDMPVAGIWEYQPASQQLQPVHHTTPATKLVGGQPASLEGSSISWQALIKNKASAVSDVSELDDANNSETSIEEEITAPIGDFGILTVASTNSDSFTQIDTELIDILATNLESIAEVIGTQQNIDLLGQVIARILRHNVRNKLTPILGYANTIAEQADKPISGYAQRIVSSCEELEQTTVHAREMREVIRNRDKMVTASLETTVQDTAESIGDEFPDGELVTHIEATPDVNAHPKLGTAIHHLIRNGLEHNDSHTPSVEITVEQRPAGPTIEIADNGPGIDPHEVRILDEHGESALRHSTGVGLWIVDRIIAHSGALIDFETTDGTTVTIIFSTPAANPSKYE